ncbi:hypothetical protein NIBR502772_06110 [Pseudarthrobacter sp. NIBRBAC000502772]|uniref:phage tail tube protein n=1 Tax=Pseudarthrobacter sp. NIBRBAC000502772 TaxID=2590775 RepID=UPI0011329B3F|nr:hypothetical protein [Pseudarthrobacter sp. NIBRBAC000502772]QDG65846.1 hypothetical protein NIBR502772_06110 [Pseudarthrobacter sp. NIBRBAC000502772]
MGVRVLADGKTKFTILTTKPANVLAPTAAELNAGIDLSLNVLSSDFSFAAADSDKVPEKPLGKSGNANAIGASNWLLAFTVWRNFLTGGGFDTAAEAGWAAVKVKGATLWAYARQTDKAATAAWAATDEIYLGAEFTTDNPQRTDGTGFIKYRVPTEVQDGYPFITVAA